MYIYEYVHMEIPAHTYTYMRSASHLPLRHDEGKVAAHVCMHRHADKQTKKRTNRQKNMRVRIHIYIYMYEHAHAHVYVQVHVDVDVHVYVYVYVYAYVPTAMQICV